MPTLEEAQHFAAALPLLSDRQLLSLFTTDSKLVLTKLTSETIVNIFQYRISDISAKDKEYFHPFNKLLLKLISESTGLKEKRRLFIQNIKFIRRVYGIIEA